MMRIRSMALLGFLAIGLAACSEGQSSGQAATSDLTRDLLAQPSTDGTSTTVTTGPALVDDGGPRVRVDMVGINRGSVTAPVKVVEMSDYGCGYCRQFHEETFPTILAEFIETGMVEWKFVPYLTGMWESSLPATQAAECTYQVAPDAFEEVNSRLWADQRSWKGSGDPASVVRPWVAEAGVDMAAFDACLAGEEQMRRIAQATTLAAQLSVRGTPTFIVLGYPPIQGALPLEAFRQVLTAVHTEAVRGNGSGDAPAPSGRP